MSGQKIALITGAYRGIGFETAKLLAKNGFSVVVSARKVKEGRKAVELLKKDGAKAYFLPMDINDSNSIRKAAQEFSGLSPHLDVLVNNAGIFPDKMPSLLKAKEETLMDAFKTNTLGAVLVIQAFYPYLEKSEHGRIINISSGLGSLAEMESYAPAYSISKTALNAVTKQFAILFKDKNISVNSVCPGWVRTEMGGPNAPRSVTEGADTVVWLASEAHKELTGKFLRDRREIAW